MPSLRGITTRVFCNGEPLEEYSTAVDPKNPSAVGCWVVSVTGKELKIHYKFETQESCAWSCDLFCDGVFMGCRLLKPQTKRHTQGKACSGDKAYSIMFSEIVETDSQEVASHGNPNVGLIEINVWRVKKDWEFVNQPLKKITIDKSPVHESKKMLGGHRIKLGKPEAAKHQWTQSVQLDTAPYTVFKINYRPLPLLRALGHVPLSQPLNILKRSASKLSESSSDSETDGEEEKIAAQMHVLQQLQDKIRNKKEAKRIKHGRSGSKRLKQEAVEIVVPAGPRMRL